MKLVSSPVWSIRCVVAFDNESAMSSLHTYERLRMTFFEDLSPYRYTRSKVEMVNVGWLGAGHDFLTGAMPQRALEELLRICSESEPFNMMRGLHDCEFCLVESPVRYPTPFNDRGTTSVGMGEFHVEGPDGRVFAAPTLVLHYMLDHDYLPPTPFIEALLASADKRQPAP